MIRYKIKKKCIEKWKSFGLQWIKNYWCDIKSENILMLLDIKKYEKMKK